MYIFVQCSAQGHKARPCACMPQSSVQSTCCSGTTYALHVICVQLHMRLVLQACVGSVVLLDADVSLLSCCLQLAEKELQVTMLKSFIRDSEDTVAPQQQLTQVSTPTDQRMMQQRMHHQHAAKRSRLLPASVHASAACRKQAIRRYACLGEHQQV